MANYWQMTLAELDRDSVEPTKHLFHFGCFHFNCPICGDVVGIWRDSKFDSVTNGMMLQRAECRHGHRIDWSPIREANPLREPCGKYCKSEWGSLNCFFRRGYMRDPETQKWIRDENGECVQTETRECDWEPREGDNNE